MFKERTWAHAVENGGLREESGGLLGVYTLPMRRLVLWPLKPKELDKAYWRVPRGEVKFHEGFEAEEL